MKWVVLGLFVALNFALTLYVNHPLFAIPMGGMAGLVVAMCLIADTDRKS